MAGKITLYVRDEALWSRARRASGPAGLSDMVHRCLREWLDRSGDAALPPMSPLERARRLRQDADELVRALEAPSPQSRDKRRTTSRRVTPSR